MIYLNLAEALNLTCDQAIFFFVFLAGKKKKSPDRRLRSIQCQPYLFFFFCKRIQIRTSSRYVLDIFTISYTVRSSSETQGLLVGSGEAARR